MRQRWSIYLSVAGAIASLLVLLTVSFAVVTVKVAIAVFVAALIFIAAKLRRRSG